MNKKFIKVFMVLTVVVLLACQCTGPFGWSFSTGCATCGSPQLNTPVAPVPTASVATPEKPLIDQLGPEQAFPGKVVGPAIAEVYDPTSGYCAVVKVNDGESLLWSGKGAFWQAATQAALVARFPHHSEEYKQNYPNCEIVLSASDVPTQ